MLKEIKVKKRFKRKIIKKIFKMKKINKMKLNQRLPHFGTTLLKWQFILLIQQMGKKANHLIRINKIKSKRREKAERRINLSMCENKNINNKMAKIENYIF